MDAATTLLQRFNLEAMLELTEKANRSMDAVRTDMLEPHPRKVAPVFTGAQVARMAGIEPKQMSYLARRGDLPAGAHSSNGARRNFDLSEAREYVRKLSGIPVRPAGARAAVLSIVNFKGGSTKTSTTFNLGQGLTLRGRRVLLVDLDAQASSTTLTGIIPPAEVQAQETAAPLFYSARSPSTYEPDGFTPPTSLEYAVQSTYWDGLDLVPAAPGLYDAEILLPISSQNPDLQWWDVLNKAIEPLREQYDYIIFDTAPALSYLAINAVMASDGLIMPVPPETLDFASSVAFWNMLSETVQGLSDRRGYHKDFSFMRVLLSKVDKQFSTNLVRDWIMATYGQYVLPVEIPKSPAGSLSALKFSTVFDLDKAAFRSAGVGVGVETYAKLRESFEKFCELIDQTVMASVWKVSDNK
jgi:chromosome partitioning protein